MSKPSYEKGEDTKLIAATRINDLHGIRRWITTRDTLIKKVGREACEVREYDIDARDFHANTAYLIAASLGYEEALKILVDAGANTNVVNEHGYSAPLPKIPSKAPAKAVGSKDDGELRGTTFVSGGGAAAGAGGKGGMA